MQFETSSYACYHHLIMEKDRKEKKGKIGEPVKESGSYVCDNCGHYQFFERGDEFEDCTSCGEEDIHWEEE